MNLDELDASWSRSGQPSVSIVLVRSPSGGPCLWIQIRGEEQTLRDVNDRDGTQMESPLGRLTCRNLAGLAGKVKEWLRLTDLEGDPTPGDDVHPQMRALIPSLRK